MRLLGAAFLPALRLTGSARNSHALILILGSALYATQTVPGVTLLHTLLKSAPGLAGAFTLSPLLLIAVATLLRCRRAA